ncbi:MAG: hypothetical protein A2Z34_04815, partial [Planctomycetes bacterium RBG_16_59_8]
YRREMPWRKTRDPYRILVSEIMLQQTQVDRVLRKYPEFLRRFPTADSLAVAPVSDVIRAWQGMGYNRRALNLQKFVREVIHRHAGIFPDEPERLKGMPGMGPATIASFLAFAFGKDIPSLDTNIRRVIHRIYYGVNFPHEKVSIATLFDQGKKLIPAGKGWDWNQAMMDFGSLICKARRPLCAECPYQSSCLAYPEILSVDFSVRRAKREPKHPDFRFPDRIYRGRVVEHLRGDARARLDEIGKAIEPAFRERDLPWLRRLIDNLVRDGLLAVQDDGKSVFVSLA